MIIKDLILYGRQLLANSDTPMVDAELLLLHVLKCKPVFLKAYPKNEISDAESREFESLLIRRAAGEPIAYILGAKDFWTFSLMVSKDVLVPRPETELLVEQALEKIKQQQDNQDIELNVLDLGTGSGAIAIALALELPFAQIFAVDLSMAALNMAQANAEKNQALNISFYHGDLFAPLAIRQEKFACIVSNPPYIAQNDPHLHQLDLQFEPKEALVAGIDGLDILRTIIADGRNFLVPNGWLLVEHGYDQASRVQALFAENNYGSIVSYLDLANHFRVTAGCKL